MHSEEFKKKIRTFPSLLQSLEMEMIGLTKFLNRLLQIKSLQAYEGKSEHILK